MATPVALPEGFELDKPDLPEGFELDAEPVSQPEDKSIKLLPSFLDFDTKESQQKRDKLLQEDPEKFVGIMQKSAIEGFNRGLRDIGEGLKQATLEAGEFIGVTEPGAAEDFTKKVQGEREKFEESYGLFPGSKVTRFLGGSAPYAYLPIKMPSGLFARAGVGAAVGGGFAGTQFVPEGTSRTEQAAIGATVGAAFPLVGKALTSTLKWANNILLEPFSKSGSYRDVAKFLRKEISENRGKIEAAVQRSVERGENKTVAQILAEITQGTSDDFGGMLVRLEKDLSRESDALKSLYAMQSQTRRGIINGIAGTEDDLVKAMSNRSAIADVNYQKSFKIPISADSKLVRLSQNKFFRVAIQDAKDLAEVKGINAKQNLTEFMHYVKEGLDKQLNATDMAGKTALGREELKAVGNIKRGLVKWIGNKNPLYEQARAQFQKDSIPVNRMEVGQELKKAFISALDQEKPAVFAGAVEKAKQTIKRSTGFTGLKKLDDIFSPEQMKGIGKLKRELTVEVQRKKMAGESKAVLKELTGEINITLPHILSRPIVIANHILKALGKDKTPEYKQLLVDMVKNPPKFLKAYKMPETTSKAKAAMDIVEKMNTIAISKTAIETSN